MPQNEDDRIDDFSAAAYAAQHANSTLKFPRVPVLDDDGNPTGQTISPSQYDEDTHKDHIGCPCCLAKLIAAGSQSEEDGSYKIDGTFTGHRHFRSKQLKDHQDACPFGHEKESVRKRAFGMLQFLNTDGRKRLNWNFMNGERTPRYHEEHQDIALKRYRETPAQMRARLENVEAVNPHIYDDRKYSVKTAGEVASMIAMIHTMDDPQGVFDSIDVISEGKIVPLTEMIAGEDWVGLGGLTQMREELRLSMPTVVTADTKDATIVTNFAGYTFVVPEFMRGGEDANGEIQGYRLLIATTDEDAAKALVKGDKVAIQGYAALDASFANNPDFHEQAGIDSGPGNSKFIMVHVRKGDHVSAITSDFDTDMDRRPVYRADYLRSIRPEPEEPENGWDYWDNDDV